MLSQLVSNSASLREKDFGFIQIKVWQHLKKARDNDEGIKKNIPTENRDK